MNCYFHTDEVAVATCQDCGIGLCKECASKYTPALCPECAEKRKLANERAHEKAKKDHLAAVQANFRASIIIGVVIAAVFLVVGIVSGMIKESPGEVIALVALGFFASFGWNAASFLAMSDRNNVMVGIISFVLRVVASFILGIPVFLWVLFKYFKGISDNKKM